MTKDPKMVDFEIDQLLESILFRYGYDFRDYARASLKRRVLVRVQALKLDGVFEMNQRILHEPKLFEIFLKDLSVTVTDMFRDPYVFKKFREEVMIHLKTYARINIWHAGCATGEEVYSMAIQLKEEGLLQKTRIYATDYNNKSLGIAEKGIYSAEHIKRYTKDYSIAGGKSSFSDYYHAKFNSVIMDESLRKGIKFANHNLVKDRRFAEMHMILCRNVLIYFNKTLQNRVLQIFQESLAHRGFLILGNKESLEFTDVRDSFEEIEREERIYRKKHVI